MATERGASGSGSHEEQVLEQALRAMAGGRPAPTATDPGRTGAADGAGRGRRALLVAAVVGAAIGIAAGLASVLVPGFPVTFP